MYSIPKNLNKYDGVFMSFGDTHFTLKQTIYLIVFGAFDLLFLAFTGFIPLILRVIFVTVFAIIQLVFITMDLEQKYKDHLNFKHSLHDVGYYDHEMNEFVQVKNIEYDVVWLKNNTMLSILEIKPIDFSTLDDDEKKSIIKSWGKYLNGVDYEIQIICRSVDVDINPLLEGMKKRIEKNPVKTPKMLQEFETTKKWINKRIEETQARNRKFYIIIPYKDYHHHLTFSDFIKMIYSDFTGKKVEYSKKSQKEIDKALHQLQTNVDDVIEKISATGVEANRLNTDQLLSLYAGFFTGAKEIDKSYITPIMNLKNSKHNFEKYQEYKKQKIQDTIYKVAKGDVEELIKLSAKDQNLIKEKLAEW